MANIGDLVVQIDANTSGLESGLDRATKATGRYRDAAGRMREANGKFVSSANAAGGAIEQTGKRAATASSAFGTLRARLVQVSGLLATIGIGIGITQSVRQVADFQTALNGLAAVSGATAQQMETLEAQARTLGATSRFSAQQAAEGQRFLAQAGFDVNETLGATPGILQLAAAAQLDLGTAADIASNVLGGMRLEVEDLNRVNDVLAATASRSNTNIQQLGQALSFAAPFAASAGISIEEAAAAIGTMSDAGIQASRAGTGLVGTIRQLSKVTDEGEDVLGKYGLSIEDVDISSRGLQPVLETLRKANISSADAIALFGSEAGAAAQVLVNDYSGAITDAAGEAERMAGVMERGLTPAFLGLGSAVSESVLQMGDSGMAGALEGLVRGATGVISVWNGMGAEWAAANGVGQEQLSTIEGIATAIETMTGMLVGGGGAIAAMALLTGGINAAKAAMVALNIAVRANPIGLLVTVLGAAAGAIYTFREELGLVESPAQTASQRVDELTSSLDENSRAALENAKSMLEAERQMNSFRTVALQMEVAQQQQRVFEEQRQFDAVGGQSAFGMGQRSEAQERLHEMQKELADVRDASGSAADAIKDIDGKIASLGRSATGAGESLDKLVPTVEQSGRKTAAALDTASSSVSSFATEAEGAARRLAAVSTPRERDPRYSLDPDEGTFSSRARERFEASAFRLGDSSVRTYGNDGTARSTWSTAAYDAAGSMSPSSATGRAANDAMNEPKNIGTLTFNLKGEGEDGSTDVTGDANDLKRLADLFSGVAASS